MFTLNDIALLILTDEVTLNDKIQIACLPPHLSTTYPSENTPVYAAGILESILLWLKRILIKHAL